VPWGILVEETIKRPLAPFDASGLQADFRLINQL
jgi:hypothetical protein